MIGVFVQAGDLYPMLSGRRNIVVIADEAHRSQYGFRTRIVQKTGEKTYGFAKYLRDALPNASFIGFRGLVWPQEVASSRKKNDGKIKAALRSPSKPLTWLVFRRAGWSGRVPLLGRRPMISMMFIALCPAV